MDVLDPDLSSLLRRNSWRNSFSTGFNYRNKMLSISLLANYLQLDINNRFTKLNSEINQNFKYVMPVFSLNWKEFSAGYKETIIPPPINDIQPVPDNTNPLFILYGNPALKPVHERNATLSYFKYYLPKLMSVNVYVSSRFRGNEIIRSYELNELGGQSSYPYNVSGLRDVTIFGAIDKQYKFNNHWQLSVSPNLSYLSGRSFVLFNDQQSYIRRSEVFSGLLVRVNWNDIIELTLSGNNTWSRSRYTNTFFRPLSNNNTRFNNELIIRWPKRFVFESSWAYRHNAESAPGIQNSYNLWNGGITYLFLKQNKGQLKFSVFDILNNNISISRVVNDNYILNSEVNVLKRYFMLSFSYDIRGIGTNKVGGKESLLRF